MLHPPLLLSGFLLVASPTLLSATTASKQPIQKELQQAIEAHSTASYDHEINSYQHILDTLQENASTDRPLIQTTKLRLAQAYYNAERFRELTEIVDLDTLEGEILKARAYIHLGQPQQAVSLLEQTREKSGLNTQSVWHLAHAYYLIGDRVQARESFQQSNASGQSDLVHLSQVYLARMDIDDKNYTEASRRLYALAPLLSVQDPLQYEQHFLLGECAYHSQQFAQAALEYEQALPSRNPDKADWSNTSRHRLIACYLALADSPSTTHEQRIKYLLKADQQLKVLQERSIDERLQLALARYYVIKGRWLNDAASLEAAEGILTCTGLFITPEASSQALLLRAEAAASYQERDRLYHQLTETSTIGSHFHAEGWYLRGLNDLCEGERLHGEGNVAEATPRLDAAVHCLTRAFELLCKSDSSLAARAVKQAIKADIQLERDHASEDALRLIRLALDSPDILASAEDPDELIYLQAWLLDKQQTKQPDSRIEKLLVQQLDIYPNGRYADAALNLLATWYYRKGDVSNAEKYYQRLTTLHPQSPFAAEAYFWQARCLEKCGEIGPNYRLHLAKVYTDFPQAPIAAEAYYSYYSVPEYLQGEAKALEHLAQMGRLFPNSPLSVQAYVLTGLDFKRTRHSPEGKVVRKRNLNEAIQAFQEAESRFDALYSKGLITEKEMDLLVALRYRAILERALANLTIATSAEGAKKHIYLEYAIEVFDRVISEIQDPNHPLGAIVMRSDPFSPLIEEAGYHLALAYIQSQDDDAAEAVLQQMLKRYQERKTTRGYYLSRAWYQEARICMRKGMTNRGLELLANAEESAKGKVLNTEEKLDLWLQRSECYRQLGQLDSAMLELSKVINDDAISGQRIQAMYLRATLYEQQGRPELAQKQLEATAKKGGPWALVAKEKLDRDYRYD